MSAIPDHVRAQLDRVHSLLPDVPREEKRMFGVVAIMLEDALLVAAYPDGSLMVRVHPDDDAELMTRPEASRPDMGAGRSMGVGWIRADAAGITDDAALALWLDRALDRHARRG